MTRRYTRLISGDDLEVELGRDEWCVIDCRFNLLQVDQGRRDYAAGHIPGAVYAHLDEDLAGPVGRDSGRHPLPKPEAFDDTLGRWGVSNDSQVVAYDDASGALAARLWWLLRWRGHTSVAVLDGGFAAWHAQRRPVSREPVTVRHGRFGGRAAAMATVETAEILSRLGAADELPLVDARDPERFAGRQEPIDPVAGHVPGALNFPFGQNLQDDGRWQPQAALRERWLALFEGRPPGEWGAMCGSGVTACSLALSAEIAGLPAPRLYTGSWSEWIRDPSRPRESG